MFNQQAYNNNDKLAKETVSGWLTTRGNRVVESGRYDIDLSVSSADGRRMDFECERRSIPAWESGSAFPYPTITIPLRKEKFASPVAYFATVNSSCTAVVVLPASVVTGSAVVLRNTKDRGWEKFYDVPIGSGWQFGLPGKKPQPTVNPPDVKW